MMNFGCGIAGIISPAGAGFALFARPERPFA
jgi:hypothetical protein